jgi:hypothetical protein
MIGHDLGSGQRRQQQRRQHRHRFGAYSPRPRQYYRRGGRRRATIQTVQPGAIVDNKRLSAVLEQVKAQQTAYPARSAARAQRRSIRISL